MNQPPFNQMQSATVADTSIRIDPDMLVALEGLLDTFPELCQLRKKYTMSLFTVLSAPMIVQLDRVVGANQSILYEAVEFMELVDQLSWFYNNGSTYPYLNKVVDRICATRILNNKDTPTISQSTMDEFFMENEDNLRKTLEANPFLLGIYLFVMVCKMVRYEPKSN